MKAGLIGLFVLAMWGSNAAATAVVADRMGRADRVATGMARQDARPTFRASTDLVTVAATVRTRRGRPVVNLKASDFVLLDSGKPRIITDFKSEPAPVSIAMLVDFSGSMEVGDRRRGARDTAAHVINFLKPDVDQAGLFVFDQKLHEVQAIAPAPGGVIEQLESMSRPFGATSLFDAIAETGRVLASAGGQRRAVIALTDGADNASKLTAAEVSGIASSIDVPVYIVVIVSPLDRAGKTTIDDPRLIEAPYEGPLANLARWTGGEIFVGVSAAQSLNAARQIVTELRQHYLIAFEPDGRPGWHPIELRTRGEDHVVRARSGYIVQDGRGQGL
jgi:Ca-activated chloride channel family protein